MARQREINSLRRLASLQQLRLIEAQADLAGHLSFATAAGIQRRASESERDEAEGTLGEVLALGHFDPDALVRCGAILLGAEETLAEDLAAEAKADRDVIAARRQWHSHRVSTEILVERSRRLEIKNAEIGEDRRARERLPLAPKGTWQA